MLSLTIISFATCRFRPVIVNVTCKLWLMHSARLKCFGNFTLSSWQPDFSCLNEIVRFSDVRS